MTRGWPYNPGLQDWQDALDAIDRLKNDPLSTTRRFNAERLASLDRRKIRKPQCYKSKTKAELRKRLRQIDLVFCGVEFRFKEFWKGLKIRQAKRAETLLYRVIRLGEVVIVSKGIYRRKWDEQAQDNAAPLASDPGTATGREADEGETRE
jgi:hypothetical protein